MLPYNDLAAVEAAFAEHGERIACVITEAAAANMGVVPPLPGFNAGLAELCRQHGALFISDEVMTGFRVSRCGWYGLDGVRPDLMTFGKVIGGGLPAAAFGGRADVMALLAPAGPVYQAGTLSGNPLATAGRGRRRCGCARREVYARVDAAAERGRAAGVARRWPRRECPTCSSALGTCSASSSSTPSDPVVADYATARGQRAQTYARLLPRACSTPASHLPPVAFEAWFVSAAHDDRALERVADALPRAPRRRAAEGTTR